MKRIYIKQFSKNIFLLILLSFASASGHAFQSSVSLVSETVHKQNLLTQTENRIDQNYNFTKTYLLPQPYFGSHFSRIIAADSDFNDTKAGLHLGVNIQLPYQIYLRAEQRFQKHTYGKEETQTNENESRLGFYYFNSGDFPFAFENPKYNWELYAESFYIPSINQNSLASSGWSRAQYWFTESGLKSNIYLELAAADYPTANFGKSYQELRSGLKLQKQFSKASVQLQIYKNALSNTAQDVRALLAIYGEWR